MLPKPVLLSTTTALLALEQQCTVLEEALDQAAIERQARDDLIYDALDSGIPYPKLEKITGLSKAGLYKIKTHHVRHRNEQEEEE